MFTEPLFPKVVKGEKTQTRRIINHFGNKEHYGKLLCHWGLSNPPYLNELGEWKWELQTEVDDSATFSIKPKYKVGEIVYLKEPYIFVGGYFEHELPTTVYKYLNNPANCKNTKFKNKLFMPESAARHFIKITAVRAERLQDISEDDCIKEGIDSFFNPLFSETRYKDYLNPNSECRSPQSSYASLINKINGKGTWESDPFVWIYDFELTNNK